MFLQQASYTPSFGGLRLTLKRPVPFMVALGTLNGVDRKAHPFGDLLYGLFPRVSALPQPSENGRYAGIPIPFALSARSCLSGLGRFSRATA